MSYYERRGQLTVTPTDNHRGLHVPHPRYTTPYRTDKTTIDKMVPYIEDIHTCRFSTPTKKNTPLIPWKSSRWRAHIFCNQTLTRIPPLRITSQTVPCNHKNGTVCVRSYISGLAKGASLQDVPAPGTFHGHTNGQDCSTRRFQGKTMHILLCYP